MNHDDLKTVENTFLAESQDFLQGMEDDLLQMEESDSVAERLEVVKRLFRAAHSIKGGAAMFGFDCLSEGAHLLEDSFALLRDRTNLADLSLDLFNQLLRGIDQLKILLQQASQHQPPAPETLTIFQQIKQKLEQEFCEEERESWLGESPLNNDLVQTIFAQEIVPILSRFETEVSQVKEEDLDKTLCALNQIYYNLSGMAGVLQIDKFSELLTPLEALLEQSDLSLDEFQQRGWKIVQELEKARQAILQEKARETALKPVGQKPNLAESKMTVTPQPVESPPIVLEESSPPTPWQRPTIRVDLEHLTELVNLVGELVINRTQLEAQETQLKAEAKRIRCRIFELNQFGSELREEYDRLSVERGENPPKPAPVHGLDPLEMDEYSEFHSTAQSVIETTGAIAHSAGKIDELASQLDHSTDHLRRITEQLRTKVIQLRVVPFSRCVDHLSRALRELSRLHHKDVNLLLLGRDTKIDESLVDALRMPLLHLLRNAFDHGIEPPPEREKLGKPPTGQIEIAAYHQGGQTIITIQDDGRGIDPEQIRQTAINKGFITPEQAASLPLTDLYDLLFWPGFSTTDTTTSLSGRGVGLDVVRSSLRQVRGSVKLDSRQGKGTTFILKLPLILSITNALLVRVEHNTLAIPLDAVEELLYVDGEDLQMAGSQSMLGWRSEFIRLARLQDLIHYALPLSDEPSPDPLTQDKIPVVVLTCDEGILAIAVERMIGQQEIVVKPLPAPLPKPHGILGTTILGDGSVILILDIDELIGDFNPQNPAEIPIHEVSTLDTPRITPSAPHILVVDDSYTIRQLLALTLKRARYQVELAKDGQEAWEKLQGGMPCDLLIADIEMPRLDGFELLEQLKTHPQFQQIPVAMLTSRSGIKHRQRAMELGAVHYFTKPYNEAQLLDTLSEILNHDGL
ncbi:hybrid sensor histidine kinase/response regulator [Spirulina subsalsa FACHB-351]|uniref:histidine kinase n=1 Tax=Spirulina subsalsa FACHB-351 TaxID=234711 RepID=A0ABT3L9K5_9CYAN|nr:hybrid sensor histidine kinase/response regulator [Spirulina subsalsa]MCW6038178.1 hybrid sensor histidine kinase/response regulator [Spirulina subsalsa FACHB-351]